jgi:hypothetical protein
VPVKGLEADGLFEVAELALGAADVEDVRLVYDRDARRVVAAVFELAQPLEDDGHDLLVADIADDSTHNFLTSCE